MSKQKEERPEDEARPVHRARIIDPYAEGFEAGQAGQESTACPYELATPSYFFWQDGFAAGFVETNTEPEEEAEGGGNGYPF